MRARLFVIFPVFLGLCAGCSGPGLSVGEAKKLKEAYRNRMQAAQAEAIHSARADNLNSTSSGLKNLGLVPISRGSDKLPLQGQTLTMCVFDPAVSVASANRMSLAVVSRLPEESKGPGQQGSSEQHSDLGEVSKQLSNPVGSLWQLVFQNDYTLYEDSEGYRREWNTLAFQPVMPLTLTENWKLINRPVIPLASYETFQDPVRGWDRDTGLGDIVLLQLFSPAESKGNWVWGFGPTWMFPTGMADLGTEKWSVGPAAVALYLGDKIIAGAILQNWFSFAGESDRASVNLMNLQYIAKYRVTPTMNVGMAPNILYDWDDEEWTIPVGLGIDKTFKIGKMPLKIGFEMQYYVVQPDDFGPVWNFRLIFTPVIPAPAWAKKPLFGK